MKMNRRKKMTKKHQLVAISDLIIEIKKINANYVKMSQGLQSFLDSKPTPIFSEKYYESLLYILEKLMNNKK